MEPKVEPKITPGSTQDNMANAPVRDLSHSQYSTAPEAAYALAFLRWVNPDKSFDLRIRLEEGRLDPGDPQAIRRMYQVQLPDGERINAGLLVAQLLASGAPTMDLFAVYADVVAKHLKD